MGNSHSFLCKYIRYQLPVFLSDLFVVLVILVLEFWIKNSQLFGMKQLFYKGKRPK